MIHWYSKKIDGTDIYGPFASQELAEAELLKAQKGLGYAEGTVWSVVTRRRRKEPISLRLHSCELEGLRTLARRLGLTSKSKAVGRAIAYALAATEGRDEA